MSCLPRYAVLLDGAFVIRKMECRLRRFPAAAEIQSVANSIAKHDFVSGLSRLRVYFYYARPAGEVLFNPISKQQLALGATRVHVDHAQLLGRKANVFASIGPPLAGGLVLSGHTDVVPVDGQPWRTDPFKLVPDGTRLYARGACDMKGFIAAALSRVPSLSRSALQCSLDSLLLVTIH